MRHEAAHRYEVDAPWPGVDRYVDASVGVEPAQLLAEARRIVRAARPESARSLEVEGEAAGAGGEDLRSHPRFAQRIDAGDHAPCVEGDVQALEVVRERADLAGTGDGEGAVVPCRHPVDAVVRLHCDGELIRSEGRGDLAGGAVALELPRPCDVMRRAGEPRLLEASDERGVALHAHRDGGGADGGRRPDEKPAPCDRLREDRATHRTPPATPALTDRTSAKANRTTLRCLRSQARTFDLSRKVSTAATERRRSASSGRNVSGGCDALAIAPTIVCDAAC